MALGCLKPQSFSNSEQQSAGVGQSVTLHPYLPYIHGRHYNGSWHPPAEPKLNLTTFSTKLTGIHHEMEQAATPIRLARQRPFRTFLPPLCEALSTCVFHSSLTWLRLSSLPGMFLHLPSNLRPDHLQAPSLRWAPAFFSALLTSYSPTTLNSNCL